LNDAMAIGLPAMPDQDLVSAYMAERIVIAEQVQAGKMTLDEGVATITARWSQVISENQQRANARNSVAAQQDAAAAQQAAAWAAIAQANKPAPMPAINPTVTCTHFPGSVTTTCN
jgi:hypothetical protein